MSDDEVLEAFRALPITTRMREAAQVHEDAHLEASKRSESEMRDKIWSRSTLHAYAHKWECEDKAETKANLEREAVVKELAEALFGLEYGEKGWEKDSGNSSRELYRHRARTLLDAGWKKEEK